MTTFALGGCALAVAGSYAVRLALSGSAASLAGIAIIPNIAILLGLLSSFIIADDTIAFVFPGAAWCVSCFGLAFWLSRHRRPDALLLAGRTAEAEGPSSEKSHTFFLAFGVLASALVPALAIASITQLPAGSAALIFIVSRIGTSIVGLGVNSVLMVKFNWNTSRSVNGTTYYVLLGAALVFISAAFATKVSLVDPGVSYIFVGLSWVSMLVAAAIIGREVNARRMTKTVATKVVVDVALALCAVGILWFNPSVSGYFGVFAVSQAVTILICAIGLRQNLVSILAAASIATALLSVVFGW
ncbi:hypothetical protein [Pseudarthrobacter sp. PvP090]|uniref:hypothetical protein n=1 Tax=Pseudarthrobacter sp. PvP090 TaxID=3156393 RepID=UPI003399AFA4